MWDVERRSREKKHNTVILPIMLVQAPSRISRFFTTFILCLLGYIMFFGTVNAVTFDTEVVPHNFFRGFREGLEDKPQELRDEIIEKKWGEIVKTCKDFHKIHNFFENQVCNNMVVGAKVIEKECEVDATIEKSKRESMKFPKNKMDEESEDERSSEGEENKDDFLYKTKPNSTLYYEILGDCKNDISECLSKTSSLSCCKIDEDQKKIQRQIKKGLNHLNRDNTLELLKKVKKDFATIKSEEGLHEGLQFDVIDQDLNTIKSRMTKADAIKRDMEEKIKEAADSMREDMSKIKDKLKDSKIGDKYKNEATRELDTVKIEEEESSLSYEVRSECEKEL